MQFAYHDIAIQPCNFNLFPLGAFLTILSTGLEYTSLIYSLN